MKKAAGAGLVLAALVSAASAAPPAQDTMAQRVQACTACHGDQGRAAADGYYPRIAGKPAGYLFNQLTGFRDGRRHYALMVNLIEPLAGPVGEAYLREIAAHFAAIDVPYPAPQPPTASPATLERGRMLALQGDAALGVPACEGCHGNALTGVLPATPGLLGLPRDYLNAQLGGWRIGNRRALAPDCMAEVAKALAPEDISAVSQWLAAQPVPVPGKAAEALPAPAPKPCGGGVR
jgi:cytochrome c553